MTTLRVHHHTGYRYGLPMTDGFTRAFLLPRSTPHQRIIETTLRIDPEPDEIEESIDVFGNRVVQFAVHHSHAMLDVLAVSDVEISPPTDLPPGPPWEDAVALLADARGDLAVDVAPFLASSPLVPDPVSAAADGFDAGLAALVDQAFLPGRPLVDAVRALCSVIYHGFEFDPGVTDITTPLATVLADRRGVCQDFAHVAVACLRSVGLAARYVSGYLETQAPEGESKLLGVDASHAWCATWVPGHGWLDLDPTNDQVPPTHHVTVAWGRDYSDVPPVRGVVIGPAAMQDLTVAVDVVRIG